MLLVMLRVMLHGLGFGVEALAFTDNQLEFGPVNRIYFSCQYILIRAFKHLCPGILVRWIGFGIDLCVLK